MSRTYVDKLKSECSKAHAIFHEVILSIGRFPDSAKFLFFEGEEDPAFYLGHVTGYTVEEHLLSKICHGRDDVLKVLDLIRADGRLNERALFFVDKDHNDFVGGKVSCDDHVFQTKWYAIENYIVSEGVFFRFWVDFLHLDSGDERRSSYYSKFVKTYSRFERKMAILMAIVLLGRGIDGQMSRKLNLNNLRMDLVFELDFEKLTCRFKQGAGKHFVLSTNCDEHPMKARSSAIRQVIARHLRGRNSKEFIRGKYELWFFYKFLTYVTHELSSKEKARASGMRRATPRIDLRLDTCAELLGPKVSCPSELRAFLQRAFESSISPPGGSRAVSSAIG